MRKRIAITLLTTLAPLVASCSTTPQPSSATASVTPGSTSASSSAPSPSSSPGPTPAADTSPGPGNRYTVAGVSFRLPRTWRQISASDVAGLTNGSDPALNTFIKNMGVSAAQFQQIIAQVDLWAFAPRPVQGFLDNVNVINNGSGGLPTKTEVRSALKSIGATLSSYRRIRTRTGDGVRYSYLLKAGALQVAGAGIVLEVGGSQVTLTFSARRASDARSYADLAQKSLQPAA